jgi:hypothetical protein
VYLPLSLVQRRLGTAVSAITTATAKPPVGVLFGPYLSPARMLVLEHKGVVVFVVSPGSQGREMMVPPDPLLFA